MFAEIAIELSLQTALYVAACVAAVLVMLLIRYIYKKMRTSVGHINQEVLGGVLLVLGAALSAGSIAAVNSTWASSSVKSYETLPSSLSDSELARIRAASIEKVNAHIHELNMQSERGQPPVIPEVYRPLFAASGAVGAMLLYLGCYVIYWSPKRSG